MKTTTYESANDLINFDNLPFLQQRVGELSIAERVKLDLVIEQIMVEADQAAADYGPTSPQAECYDTVVMIGPCLEDHTSYYSPAHARV